MPIICNLTGFIPSIIIMLFTALYMNITAKMIIQANFIYQLDNIIDLSEKVLGKKIKIISSIIFTLLFTTILSAYISKGGNLIQELILISTNLNIKIELCYIYLILFSTLIINLKNKNFDNINNIFIIIFIIIFIFLIYKLIKNIKISNLITYNLTNAKYIYTILITAFGFHNILPYIKNNYKEHSKIKNIIDIGMIITFIIYVVWIFLILSIMPSNDSFNAIKEYHDDKIVTELILNYANFQNTFLTINTFALLAIVTSILGISMGMKLFFTKLLNLKQNIINKLILSIIIFLPPVLILSTYKNIFFIALNLAGGIFTLILFGLLPSVILLKTDKIKVKSIALCKIKILTIITILMILISVILYT